MFVKIKDTLSPLFILVILYYIRKNNTTWGNMHSSARYTCCKQMLKLIFFIVEAIIIYQPLSHLSGFVELRKIIFRAHRNYNIIIVT